MKNKRNKIVLSVSIMFFLTLLIPAQNTFLADNTEGLGMGNSFDTSHTVFGEQGTATWCVHCPSMGYWLKQVVGDFIYVALVDDKNNYAAQRNDELGLTGFPTTFFDGGYTSVIGHQYSVTNLQNAYNQCAARDVWDVSLDITAAWMGGGQMLVSADVTNNEASSYSGHLHIYVTEIVSRWDDYDGDPYSYAMINNYAINQDVTVSAGSTETITETWSGYTDITMNNIKVMGSVFRSSTMDTDESDSVSPIPPNTDPPSTPSQPSGPSSGYVGIDYTYSTSSTEINGDDIKYGVDWDGDDVIDEWTDFYPSGQTVHITHAWDSVGTYNVKVKARDIFGKESGFSSIKQVDISIGDPPLKPLKPSGDTEGLHSKSYSYSSSTTDPNAGDKIYYKFDWNDFTSTDWLGPYNSGQSVSESHRWDDPGTYNVKVKAKDLAGSESPWSDALTVEMGNTAPDIPDRPVGPSSGIVGVSYTYSTDTSDNERDDVEYFFEWGDYQNSGWVSSPFASHTWLNPGDYAIRVKARDQWDESGWSSYKTVVLDEGSLSVEIQADPDAAMVGEEIQFNAIPIGGIEPFTFNWDFGDGNTSTLQNPTHIYESMGQYTVSVSALDKIGAFGSNYTTVDIILTHPPDIPIIIDGPNQIIVGQEAQYNFSATDPDGDNVYIMVDWGDNSENLWYGPYPSGQEISLKHTWENDDSYNIKAKSKDIHEYESDWSQSYQVTAIWNQAFLIGKQETISQTEEKIEIKAISLIYLTTDPFKIKVYNNEESIIVSADSDGFIGESFIFGKFLVGYMTN